MVFVFPNKAKFRDLLRKTNKTRKVFFHVLLLRLFFRWRVLTHEKKIAHLISELRVTFNFRYSLNFHYLVGVFWVLFFSCCRPNHDVDKLITNVFLTFGTIYELLPWS